VFLFAKAAKKQGGGCGWLTGFDQIKQPLYFRREMLTELQISSS
jgi:hypothetical protein